LKKEDAMNLGLNDDLALVKKSKVSFQYYSSFISEVMMSLQLRHQVLVLAVLIRTASYSKVAFIYHIFPSISYA
jgi:hypothetical protein